jgi:hypothetical protein
VIGWDAELETFFGQVMPYSDDCDDDDLVAWWGTRWQEITNVWELVELMKPYADIRKVVAAELERDRAANPTSRVPERCKELLRPSKPKSPMQ